MDHFHFRRLCLTAFYVAIFIQQVSCTFTVPDRASDPVILPESYSIGYSVNTPAQKWWETFEDSQLDALVQEALDENQSVRSFWARLDQARARARKAGSELFPSLTGEADASYSRTRIDDGIGSRADNVESYSLGILAGYEVDLWGRVKASVQSTELNAVASREDLNSAAMTIAAEVVQRWIGVISQRRKLLFLHQQLEANKTYLDLIELRFQKSLATSLDVMQQKQVVERVKAQIPLEELQERILLNELAVLLGRVPGDVPDIKRQALPEIKGQPVTGIPSAILENRPDIRAAFYRLQAADQDLFVAKAERLPSLRLTGRAAYNSGALESLFDNWLLNLASGLTAPLFDGGLRQAQVDVDAAVVDEQLASYRQVVLTSVREVEDALVREEKLRQHIMQKENQLKAARSALSEAQFRYMNGLNDYLPVLTQLLSIQNLEIDLIQRRADLLSARINLYRALGGTWVDELVPPGQSEDEQIKTAHNDGQ